MPQLDRAVDPDVRWSTASICMLMYVDMLVLKQFRTPDEIAIYYAALKTLSLVAFVYFAVSAGGVASLRGISRGRRPRAARRLPALTSMRWTFWPSLGATVIAARLRLAAALAVRRSISCSGYHLMFILAIGMLARASIGPGERFLNDAGRAEASARWLPRCAFAVNLGLCLMLMPRYGVDGRRDAIDDRLRARIDPDVVVAQAQARISHLRVPPPAHLAWITPVRAAAAG